MGFRDSGFGIRDSGFGGFRGGIRVLGGLGFGGFTPVSLFHWKTAGHAAALQPAPGERERDLH